jgi:regulator of protease activity HflC (stomatin/prohibitin superfamily)
MRTLVVAAVVIVGLALVPLVASSLKKTPKDRIGISYGGGPIESASFQRVVQPGSRLFFNGFFDPLYLYPSDQQNYIVSTVASEGAKPRPDAVVAPSKDRVQVSYQVAVYYRLNTDLLRPFHEQFGLKYEAYTPAGWERLIEDTFRQQLENAIQEETRRYAVADIYGDADLLLKIQGSVQTTLSDRLELAMGQRYFCSPTFEPGGECSDPTFVIKKVDLPKSVIGAFEANRTSEIKITTKANEVEQRREEARGIALLDEALGENGAVYALLKAIESGGVKFWVLPSDGGVTLNTPDGATGTVPTPGN